MMSAQPNTINGLLQQLGLESQDAEIYLYLIKNENSSALEISKGVHMGRTTVYRILDRLQYKGLVSQISAELGLKFQTTPIQNIDLLVLQKEQEAAALRRSAPLLIDQLEMIQSAKQQGSKVVYYKGREGLKQVTWNSLQAKELLTIEIDNLESFMDHAFAEKVRLEFSLRQIPIRQITNKEHFAPFTKQQKLVDELWQVRHLKPAELKINFETLIYNNVCAMYNYTDGEIFCVEIYNPQLANMQRSLFEFIWKSAKPLKIIGKGGEAELHN